ncbi:hypothetical protein A1D22_09465 [Pasteurellaceae bacterium LFhippo2]|nr:hypothetical protein [Pasteurellaceae bacterium LFhippo2]
MKKLKQNSKALKGVSLAMGIVASFFSAETQAYPKQKDVLQVIHQIKSVSATLTQHIENQSIQLFGELSKLTQTVSLLNAVVRSMKQPEKVVDDITAIDFMLEKLADSIRMTYAQHFRHQADDRAIFKNYKNEIFRFNLFAIKLRQELGLYQVVPSQNAVTQQDLDILIADSNKRYAVNG